MGLEGSDKFKPGPRGLGGRILTNEELWRWLGSERNVKTHLTTCQESGLWMCINVWQRIVFSTDIILTRIRGIMSLCCLPGVLGEVLLLSRHRSVFLYIGAKGHLRSFSSFKCGRASFMRWFFHVGHFGLCVIWSNYKWHNNTPKLIYPHVHD